MIASRILANALVDCLDGERYSVTVWDGNESETPDHADNLRCYTIHERTEDRAAQEAIRLFVSEMTALLNVAALECGAN